MTQSLTLPLDSLHRTRAVGMALGGALPERALCLFFGEMGAGKTTLIKAVCEGLGIAPEHVISPTYTLVNIYPGRVSVYHVDFFRIEDAEALLELDRDDWINPAGPTLIEWPELALPLLRGEDALELRLTAPPHPSERRELRLTGAGGGHEEVLRALRRYAAEG